MKYQESAGFPLSPQQKHIWLLQQAGTGAPWRTQCAVSIEGHVSVELLERSLQKIVNRHEILRTSFHRQPGLKIPLQVISDISRPRWQEVDLSGYENGEREIRIAQLFRTEGDRCFDFENGSPLRLLLATTSPDSHLLIATLPAICGDSITLRNVMRELGEFYAPGRLDESSSTETMQYADFAEWQNELLAAEDEEAELGKSFWKEQLLSSPPGPLPFEGEHEEQNQSRESEPDVAVVATTHVIDKVNNDRPSAYAVLLACWQTLLSRLTGQSDFVVEVITDGREYEELQGALGPYAKSLPLNCSFANNPRFSEVVEQVQASLDSAREWQGYFDPEEYIGARGNTSAIAFEFDERDAKQSTGCVTFSVVRQYSRIDRFRVKLCCVLSENSLTTEFHYDSALFQSKTIERIAGHFATLLYDAIENPEARVSELAVLSEAERWQILIDFNQTNSKYPAHRCIHELIEEQAEKTPAAPAIVFEQQALNYAELDAKANQLAHFLIQRGVGPGVKVGLCVERSLDMIVGLLGILKAGAAYVPLSPEHPKARLLTQLTDIQAPVLVTQEKLIAQLPDFDGEVVCLDRDRAQFENQPTTNPKSNVSPEQLVYVIYTSGSTGAPKGVAVSHQNLVNYTDFICKKLNLDQSEDALQFASVSTITADLGNTCIFPSLVSGGCLHILSYETATDRARFADYFSRHQIDVLKIVPSHLSSLLDSNAKPNLLPQKYLILGGETLSWELVERIHAINPDCEVINHYGPTETTVGSLTFSLEANGASARSKSSVPIGRPIANTEIFILDQHLNPVPVGVAGQLYIGGAGLAHNYLNQPEQTAERFVANPFSRNGATRLYNTGDRARYLADGNVEFLGRGDNQVKIRGFRVELGEVEATLTHHPGVRKVVVLAREIDEGDKQLVAYVVPALDQAPTISELRSFLKEIVPEYMIPSAFVFLKELPLTRNGKVDRAVLPIPDPSRPELQKTFVAPGTPTEELIAGIWAELLKLNRVGTRDSFFELGGHSLLATQVISRLRETFQVELPLSSLFETPTVAGLAQRIERERFASQDLIAKPILPAPRESRPPLSFAQQRLWLLDQLEPGSSAYNVSRAVRVSGALNYEALRKTLYTLVARHESLRTTFDSVDGMPYQVIAESAQLPMHLIDLAALPSNVRGQQAEKLITQEAQQPYDLARGPLTRVTVIRLETDHHILLLNNHHIISDGWSAGILFEELALLYHAFSLDQSPQLPPLPIQYADYARWQREWLNGKVLERQIDYWKQQLDGAPALLELPTDRPRPAVQTHRGGRERIKLPAELAQAVKSLSQREGVTLFMTFLATFQLLLSRHSGQDDIVVGSPIAGRTRVEIERLIGFFLNTLVLRTRLSDDPTFRDLLRRVRDVALAAYANQHIPFERLIEELQPARDLSHSPLFQVFLNVLNFAPIEIDLPGLTLEPLPTPDVGSKFDLTLYAVDQKDGMTLELLYNSDLFERDRIVEMLKQFEFLLTQIVDRPDEKISSFSLVTPESKQLLPRPRQPLPATFRAPIYTLFSQQAGRAPDQLAVVDPNESLTYRELNYRSNQLANCLLASGISTGDTVAIYGHRSAPLVWAVMGVLKAGAAFVILDPAYPVSRLIRCLQIAQPRAWLQITAAGALPNDLDEFVETLSCCCRLNLRAEETLLSEYAGDDPQINVDADDLAYVAFTSGSTGVPKGILGRHGPLTLFTAWAKDLFDLNDTDRFSMLSGLAHDPLQRDIFTPLQIGATLCIPDPEDLAVPPKLVEWFNEQKITVTNLTPAMAQVLCETTWTTSPMQINSLRYAFLVGDVLRKRDALRLKVLAPSLTCVNLYGSTETQRAVAYFMVPPVPAQLSAAAGQRPIEKEILPLGRGIQEVQLLLLNSAQQMSGVGEVGEIYFRSPHLAKGYLGDAALTKERFLLNPFTKATGDRLYRTGDLGRYMPDGNVEFMGRADRQVKVRGFRIELGEVEAALTSHPEVGQAVVILREKDPTEKYLATYFVPVQGSKITIAELRRYLKETLPDYMVPTFFAVLEALPLTPNGKLDEAALPEPDHSRLTVEEDFEAPRTETEEKLASIWEAVLKVDSVSINDNFFELGGHSLLATQAVGRIRNSLQIDLPLAALFEAPTIKGLAEKLRTITTNGNGSTSTITPVSRASVLPLSFAQQRLWFLNELEDESAFYNVPWAVHLRGELDVQALRKALETIIQRHETLRTRFTVIEGQPFQVISDSVKPEFSSADLSDLPNISQEKEARRLAITEATRRFDLRRAPLIRVRLLRLRTDDHVLCVTSHHIVSDGWSIGVFVRELKELYESFISGRPHRLPELTVQYADYAVWQRERLQGEVFEKQLTYWKEQLRGVPAILDLPKDRPRPAVQTFHGAIKSTTLSPELTNALNELSRQEGVTLFITLLAAFQLLLCRYSSQEDIVVGSPIAGRNQEEIEQLIGFFVNTLVLRTDLSRNPKFSELLQRVRKVALEAYANQELPFEKLVEELQPERSLGHTPLFQVMFVLQNAPRGEFKLKGLTLSSMRVETKTSKFDLTLYATESAGKLKLTFEYNTDLFDDARIDRMLEHLRVLLEGVVRKPETRIGALEILTGDERRQLLIDWNQTAAEFPVKCIPQLFEEQVARTPEHIAVISESGELTYEELNRRANQLARYLQKRGVGPEVLVGVCVERSLEMVVGLLGIMKAGGAYVPLDPAYPAKRLQFMLEDASARLLLTQQPLLQLIPETRAQVVCLDSDWTEISKESDGNLATKPVTENLAYVIYTSGSTGRPKGVAIEHRSAVALLDWAKRTFSQHELAGVLASTSICFDLSVFELFVPLSFGGRVILAEDALELPALRANGEVRLINTVPSAMTELLRLGGLPSGLETVNLAGEPLKSALVDQIYRELDVKRVFDLYGPSEDTTYSTCALRLPNRPATIGRPVSNTRLYILDPWLNPVPIGVPGELCIGGSGLARGYLNRPELTAEKFIPDSFGDTSGGRLYKTGDLVRYQADGNVEYLGRVDQQVKIRGYRIELDEIGLVINQHPGVRDAVVIAREDHPEDKRLVAYVVPGLKESGLAPDAKQNWDAEQVSQWQSVWDETYREASSPETTFNIVGWNSSYTGESIPAEEMREWVDCTVERIGSLSPRNVLEIGCGTGLLLFRIAPHCERYHGTDLSHTALDYVREQLSATGLQNVTLSQQAAEDFEGLPTEAFDTVILNSVVQYFPSIDSFVRVLEGVVKALKTGGSIFLGDLRSLPLLEAFHSSVQLQLAPPSLSVSELRQRSQKQISQEKELLIDPGFFSALKSHLPRIGRIEVQLKRGRHHNELTKFRYDVILHVGDEPVRSIEGRWLRWQTDVRNVGTLRRFLLENKPEIIGITGMPNARLTDDVKLLELIASEEGSTTTDELRRAVSKSKLEGAVEPEDLWALGGELGYAVEVRWGAEGGTCDLLLRKKGTRVVELTTPEQSRVPRTSEPAWNRYSNNPLQAEIGRSLVPDLRRSLTEKLPQHMIPSAFVLLDALPLTANGKIDRRALPAPGHSRPELAVSYAPPRTSIEETLAEIWTNVLGLENVGIHDNFFELGGDSILSIRIIASANKAGLGLTPKQMFQHQTIAELAAVAGTARFVQAEQVVVAGAVPLTPIQHWLFEQNLLDVHHFNQATLLEVQTDLDFGLLKQAVLHLLRHHDALRLRFVRESTGWKQFNAGPESEAPVIFVDLSATVDAQQEATMGAAICEAQASLNLSDGPLLRIVFFDFGSGKSARLLIVIHHLAVDGVSWRILLEDLQTVYKQLIKGETVKLPPKTTSFKRWAELLAEHVQTGMPAHEQDYWLADERKEFPRLPVDYPAGENSELSADTVRVSLSVDETRALLQKVPEAYRTQINDVMLTGLVQGFAKWTGESRILVDLEGHGREEIIEGVDLSRTVGWFTTIFPVLLTFNEAMGPGEALKAVKEQLREIPNRGIGYGLLRYLGGESRIVEELRSLPEPEVSFNYFGQFGQERSESGMFSSAREEKGPTHSPRQTRKHLLDVNASVAAGQLKVHWTYSKNVHRRDTIEALANDFILALRELIAHCQFSETGGYTPSDFPMARLSQETLDKLVQLADFDQAEEQAR